MCTRHSSTCSRLLPCSLPQMDRSLPQGYALPGSVLNVASAMKTALSSPYSVQAYSSNYLNSLSSHTTTDGYSLSSTYDPRQISRETGRPRHPAANYPQRTIRHSPHTIPHWYQPGHCRCTHPGCTFVGAARSLEIHKMDRHLIYPPDWEHRRRGDDWDADPSLKGYVHGLYTVCIH